MKREKSAFKIILNNNEFVVKFKFFDKTTICELHYTEWPYSTRMYKGVAVCDDRDIYDPNEGKSVAYRKAIDKLFSALHREISQEISYLNKQTETLLKIEDNIDIRFEKFISKGV